MMETYNWVGKSGVQYPYQILQIEDDIAAGQDGNYVFCKIYKGTWLPIYIGEGDLRERTSFSIKEGCVIGKGATHPHAHLNKAERDRKFEESDLLDAHTVVFLPIGCNRKSG